MVRKNLKSYGNTKLHVFTGRSHFFKKKDTVFLLLLFWFWSIGFSQTDKGVLSQVYTMRMKDGSNSHIRLYKESHALIINNYFYKNWRSFNENNARQEMTLLKTTLTGVGFKVITYENLGASKLEDIIRLFF